MCIRDSTGLLPKAHPIILISSEATPGGGTGSTTKKIERRDGILSTRKKLQTSGGGPITKLLWFKVTFYEYLQIIINYIVMFITQGIKCCQLFKILML